MAVTPRLINVSELRQVGAGTTLTAGFVVGGSGTKQVLIRAVDPSLAHLDVGGTMADPKLALFNNTTGVKINETNNENISARLVGLASRGW